ncbi:hypothetical protein [Thioalkalivibrio sp. ALE23]|uniref:hypothetical protein n=1 Tax=Thioalkalivibrio sp. ALE23 TaxID=1265495 RepID=UPI0003703428|nr:hypothetical protein [Thioalkalivibrio sp. ALE23]
MSEIKMGVLRMPDELFWSDEPMIRQQHNQVRYEAADEIERLRAENERLRQSHPVPEWQPIDTAPKDGTQILGAWILPYSGQWIKQPITYTSTWVTTWDHADVAPSQWMPLPDDPQDAGV